MSRSHNPLRLNVGFITKQPVGYSREFHFNETSLHLPPDLRLDQLTGSAWISRTPQGLLTRVHLQALTQSECVRCLRPFSLALSTNFTELFAFSARSVSDSGLILPRDGYIDLTPLAREYLILEIPISPVCTPECVGLCPICGENQNTVHCQHGAEDIDPRFEVLKALLGP